VRVWKQVRPTGPHRAADRCRAVEPPRRRAGLLCRCVAIVGGRGGVRGLGGGGGAVVIVLRMSMAAGGGGVCALCAVIATPPWPRTRRATFTAACSCCTSHRIDATRTPLPPPPRIPPHTQSPACSPPHPRPRPARRRAAAHNRLAAPRSLYHGCTRYWATGIARQVRRRCVE